MDNFITPENTRIGHIHLKVSELDKALSFYHRILGFQITQRLGNQVVFLSAGGYHHHIALNTWQSAGAGPAPKHSTGLFHTAIVFSTRKDLAVMYQRLKKHNYPLTGAADHGVSEALYMDDPDGNGVELYWDRPVEEWPRDAEGNIAMYTRPLNLENLLDVLQED